MWHLRSFIEYPKAPQTLIRVNTSVLRLFRPALNGLIVSLKTEKSRLSKNIHKLSYTLRKLDSIKSFWISISQHLESLLTQVRHIWTICSTLSSIMSLILSTMVIFLLPMWGNKGNSDEKFNAISTPHSWQRDSTFYLLFIVWRPTYTV